MSGYPLYGAPTRHNVGTADERNMRLRQLRNRLDEIRKRLAGVTCELETRAVIDVHLNLIEKDFAEALAGAQGRRD